MAVRPSRLHRRRVPRFRAQVLDTVSGRSQSIDRIGAALVAERDGQREVIALLHRQGSQIDGIGTAVEGIADTVDGIAVAQEAVSESIGVLTSLCAVNLGFSILTPAVLLMQYTALCRRLDRLLRDMKGIESRLDAMNVGDLNAGLTKLSAAGEVTNAESLKKDFLLAASDTLTDSQAYYTAQLQAELAGGAAANRQFAWLVARHLMVASLGVAACHLRHQQSALAVKAIKKALGPLRNHAAAVFRRTVGAGASPIRYLMPGLKEHGVTLESLAELHRQAEHAGVLDGARKQSATEFFEDLRGYLASAQDPWFRRTSTVQKRRCEFAEATAAVEEVNRIQGLVLALCHCGERGLDYFTLEREILADVEARSVAPGSCYAYFPESPPT